MKHTTAEPAQPASRQRILDVATEEFAARGFDGARIETIMRRSEVSKNLIYHYFKSKDQLFQTVLEENYEKFRFDQVDWPDPDADPAENMRALVNLIFAQWSISDRFIKLLTSENFSHGVHIRRLDRVRGEYARRIEKIEAVLAEGVRRGQFRDGIDPVELYVSISSLVYHRISNRYTLSFLMDRQYDDAEKLAACREHILQMVMAYLAAPDSPEA